ncbi:alpha/beta fold hydrolase [Patescibacteria group bacterium]
MQNGFLEYNKGKIFYQIDGDGEPIVFIHGFSLDHRMWTKQVEYFSKYYQVITYDMRGFGKSSIPASEYSHHEDLNALLKFLKIKKAHIIGLSLGGEVAIDFTLEYLSEVESLTLLSSSLGGYTKKTYAVKVDWDIRARKKGMHEGKRNWLNHEIFRNIVNNSKTHKDLVDMVKYYSGWHWLNNDLREKLGPPAIDRLKEITVPTMICVGENDIKYFKTILGILNKSITESKKVLISGSGHMVNMEEPIKVNKLIEKHITR